MPKCTFSLSLLLLATLVAAKDKPPMPAIITSATYVLVTTYDGDVFNPNVTPEDRQAVGDVQEALQKWGRYKLVYKRDQADLILVVRTGRAVQVRGGVEVGSRKGPQGSGQSLGAEAGDPLDSLSVYIASQGTDSAPLWRGRSDDGFDPPDMKLIREFRSKVEAATVKKP